MSKERKIFTVTKILIIWLNMGKKYVINITQKFSISTEIFLKHCKF